MAARKVTEIHVVCRGGTNVENLSDTAFNSGWWKIGVKHVREGVVFALHEAKDRRSYLHGVVDGPPVKGTGDRKGRVMVRVRRQGDPLPWRGGGSGTTGYLWEGLDTTGFERVPISLEGRDAGRNTGVKSLLEAESYKPVRWDGLAGVGPEGKTGEGEDRQRSFVSVLEDLAAALEGRRIPVEFVDATGTPYRLDHGCIAMAINAGVLKDETQSRRGERMDSVDLDDAYREDLEVGRGPAAAEPEPDLFDGSELDGTPPEAFREATVRARQGQGRFRDELLLAYGGRCAVTGTAVEAILEAAHIIPHSLAGNKGMDRRNGILLRADLHGLFDFHLLGLRPDPAGGPPTVVLAEALRGSEYGALDGKPVASPSNPSAAPSRTAVELRWSKSGLDRAAGTDGGRW